MAYRLTAPKENKMDTLTVVERRNRKENIALFIALDNRKTVAPTIVTKSII